LKKQKTHDDENLKATMTDFVASKCYFDSHIIILYLVYVKRRAEIWQWPLPRVSELVYIFVIKIELKCEILSGPESRAKSENLK
jgi:hypothetical protein